jgi:hypothetical protein
MKTLPLSHENTKIHQGKKIRKYDSSCCFMFLSFGGYDFFKEQPQLIIKSYILYLLMFRVLIYFSRSVVIF